MRATVGQALIRWQKQMQCFQIDHTPKTQSDEHWSQMVLKTVYMCSFVCADVYLSIMCVTAHVTALCVWERQQERVVGLARSSVCQRSQSSGSLIPLPSCSENFLSSFPVLIPCWARRATPGKFMLMSAMKTPPTLHHISQYLSNSSLSILSLSLHSLLSLWIFPLLLMYVSEILNPCWRGVSHFTWLVVSAGTLVTQLSIGFLRGWASLGVSFKV